MDVHGKINSDIDVERDHHLMVAYFRLHVAPVTSRGVGEL